MAYSLDTQQMKQTASRNNGRNYSTAAAIFFTSRRKLQSVGKGWQQCWVATDGLWTIDKVSVSAGVRSGQ